MSEHSVEEALPDMGEQWYDAYKEWNSAFRSVPDPLPDWADLPQEIQRSWFLQSIGIWRHDLKKSLDVPAAFAPPAHRPPVQRPPQDILIHGVPRLQSPFKSVGHVYFIGATGGPIKIGISGLPSQRLQSLQTASPIPLSLLASYPSRGAREEESALHRRFAHLRLHGEWFSPGEDLLQFIAELKG